MQKADILLAPSVTSKEGDQEGIPVTLMEALAKGLLVLSILRFGPKCVLLGEGLLKKNMISINLTINWSIFIETC